MNKKQFLDKIFDKWLVKVFCLVAAIIIYFIHQIAILDKKDFSIPVEVHSYGMMIPSEIKNYNVKVTVRGKSEELNAILESDLTAYLDITGVTKEGEVNVPVIINPSTKLSVLDPLEINVNPDKIKIDVQFREEKIVPVVPLIAGECAHGYEISSITSEPSAVLITGPRKIVESITEINTDVFDISNAVKTVVQDVSLRNHNRLISLNTDENIKITAEVKEVDSSRQFNDLYISCSKVPENLIAKNISKKASIWVDGTLLNIEKLKSSSFTLSVDCSSVKEAGEYELPVNIRVPYYVTLKKQEPETVTVSFTEKPVEKEVIPDTGTNHEEENINQ